MQQLLAFLATLPDLALVVLGFGFIIFIHELGHFLAAKWAGIRVLAFAIGFGRPLFSYRKGMGLRFGRSTEPEYKRLLEAERTGINPKAPSALSSTEYRLNWLPLGGYVKMLGQDDMDPRAVSAEPDSYQNTKPWKRMVVISAGVVMNLILAAVLFIAVFMTGLKTEPPEIGGAFPGSPASRAVATNAEAAGVVRPGLQSGDVVLKVNGRQPEEFTDLVLAAAMSPRGQAVVLEVRRPGVAEKLKFSIVPEVGGQKLLEMGVFPAMSNVLKSVPKGNPELEEAARQSLADMGLAGVQPGSRLVAVNGEPAEDESALERAAAASEGAPLQVVFQAEDGSRIERQVDLRPELERTVVELPSGMKVLAEHLLGLTPVMQVDDSPLPPTPEQGLKPGDVFVRLGNARYPSLPEGMAEIHAHKGREIAVDVLRQTSDGARVVPITPPPTVKSIASGQIGFVPATTQERSTLLALPPRGLEAAKAHPGSDLVKRPGTRVLSIAGRPVANMQDVREALLAATAEAREQDAPLVALPVQLELPVPAQAGDERVTETVSWTLTRDDLNRLSALSWRNPVEAFAFEPKEFVLQATGPLHAVQMGIHKTQRVMTMTYLTFARLFQGTVKVEHLKGPVGIAQMGTKVAERGLVWLLFFMALISVNLAVINFLPLPIVDGGQFLFLVLEQVRGRPVSVQVQNVTTMIGLLLIGTMFVIVTFNDIVNLFG